MTTQVALLRGINVGGRHQLAMADLRAAFSAAGALDVSTYIQSGNVVFRWPGRSPATLRADLEARLEAVAGFAVPVTLRSDAEMAAVVAGAPFPTDEPTHLHVSFLQEPPGPAAFASVDRAAFAPEDFAVAGRDLYLFLPHGMARTKLPQALGLTSRVPATTRNWRTVVALRDLAAAG
jgi:uncharacterized protein (DUF1697 family)